MDREKYVDVISSADNTNQSEGVIIPIARTSTGELVNIELKNENGATFISGFPGSGKSTMIRLILASVLMNIKKKPVDIFLADAKGYEFPELNKLSKKYLKEMFLGTDEKFFEDFIHKLYLRLIEIRTALAEKGLCWYNIDKVPESEKPPVTLVIIDDMHVLFQSPVAYDYIHEFETLIREGWGMGFRFVLLSQNYQRACGVLPGVIQGMIGQKIYLSPYDLKEIIENDIDQIRDMDIKDNQEKFSVLIKKRSTGQYETGKMFYIIRNELETVIENL